MYPHSSTIIKSLLLLIVFFPANLSAQNLWVISPGAGSGNEELIQLNGNSGVELNRYNLFGPTESLEGIADGQNGQLYLSGNTLGHTDLLQFDIGNPGNVTDFDLNHEFQVPANIAYDSNGTIFGTSTAFDKSGYTGIYHVNSNGSDINRFTWSGMSSPYDIEIGSARDLIYVSDRDNGTISVFDRSGILQDNFTAMNGPGSLALGVNNLFLAGLNGNVQEYDLFGNLLSTAFSIPGSINDIVFGPDGNLYLSSRENDKIYRYDLNGGDLSVFANDVSGGTSSGPTFLVFSSVPEPGSSITLVCLAMLASFNRRQRR